VPHTFRAARAENGSGKHDWAHWSAMLEEWIRFHQAAHGKAGPEGRGAIVDRAEDETEAYRKLQKELWKGAEAELEDLGARVERIEASIAKLADKKGAASVLEAARQQLARGAAELSAILAVKDSEAFGPTQRTRIDNAKKDLDAALSGIADIDREAQIWALLDAESVAAVRQLFQELPPIKSALMELITARPEVFKEDAIGGGRFAEQLLEHVRGGFVTSQDLPGLVQFLQRIKNKVFEWKMSGFSHSGCASMLTALNHPGLILRLIEAARRGQPFPLPSLYPGDGPATLRPTEDLANGFRRAFSTSWLPGATLSYERGFLRAIVEELKPSVLPPDRPAARCDPVAVALSRLTGTDVRYGWAFKLKTGKDLIEALESQQGEGIAMADVRIAIPNQGSMHLHFPVFHSYDPASRTVVMEDFSFPGRRLPVEGLTFPDDRDLRPAIYYRPHPGIEKFLTLDLQRASRPAQTRSFTWGEEESRKSRY
jgi:hypothetical protein